MVNFRKTPSQTRARTWEDKEIKISELSLTLQIKITSTTSFHIQPQSPECPALQQTMRM